MSFQLVIDALIEGIAQGHISSLDVCSILQIEPKDHPEFINLLSSARIDPESIPSLNYTLIQIIENDCKLQTHFYAH